MSIVKEDCEWYKNGDCGKGLPGTPCDIYGCVVYRPNYKSWINAPDTSGEVRGDTSTLVMNELGNTPADKNYQPSGISKAEDAAWEAYPNILFPFTPLDLNAYRREAFINGYEQAEKDLALTIEDLELLHTFIYAVKNNKSGCFTFTRLSDKQYQEVLRRFNERKK